ncbi:MAG: ABC transporter transmembrane domain-containing protein [Hyphomicrobium sp.]|nr:ABC transporter transmembrane domain-containing protein [Hyphomicrobium sp.]
MAARAAGGDVAAVRRVRRHRSGDALSGVGEARNGDSSASGLAKIVDEALQTLGIPNELGYLLAAAVATLYLQIIFQTWKSWCETDCQTRYTAHWQRRIFDAFMDAQWSFFTAERAASRVNVMTNEAGRISAAFYLLEQMLTCLVFIVVYAAIAVAASWQMVEILVAFGAAVYLLTRPLSRRSYQIGTQVSVVSETLQHRATEFVFNAKLIKATATESIAKLLFGRATEEFRHAYRMAGFHPKLIFGIYMLAGYTLLGVGTWIAVERLQVNPAAVAVSIYVFLRLYVQLTNFQQYRQGFLPRRLHLTP